MSHVKFCENRNIRSIILISDELIINIVIIIRYEFYIAGFVMNNLTSPRHRNTKRTSSSSNSPIHNGKKTRSFCSRDRLAALSTEDTLVKLNITFILRILNELNQAIPKKCTINLYNRLR